MPTLRSCGLTEDVATYLINEDYINVGLAHEEESMLDNYRIMDILPKGFVVLNQGVVEEEPVAVSIVQPPKTTVQKIFDTTRSGTWDLIKIAFGAALGALAKHYFDKL